MPVPNIIKIFQTINKLWSAKEFALEIRSGEIPSKRTKQELSFLHATLLLDLIYVPTKYIKLSQIVWELWPAQNLGFKGDNYITKKSKSCLSCMQRSDLVDIYQYAKIIKIFQAI